MKALKLFLVALVFCSACANKEKSKDPDISFDRTKWDITDGSNYVYRKQMINDLLNNHQWAGLTKDSVISLLGQPNEIEENIFMLYHYEQTRLGGFPLAMQELVIELNSDSTVVLARTN
jgi:hypothetical protein